MQLRDLLKQYATSIPTDTTSELGPVDATEFQDGRTQELPESPPSSLPDDRNSWPEDWRERFEERAAIMEYEGGLSEEEAEREAEQQVRKAFADVCQTTCREEKFDEREKAEGCGTRGTREGMRGEPDE